MADCGTSEYQAIEYLGLYNLQDAQIVTAQIDTLNVVTRTATIIIVEECEKNAWIPLEEVPFYYHCETSTGTIEDLANGYKAFADGDIVYVLAIPAKGAQPYQVFIVGHVDVRGTYRCISDMLLITLPYVEEGVGAFTRFTIFDVGLGAQLDIAAFENIDELSPAKPTVLPGLYNSAATDWITYNFDTVVPTVEVPVTLSKVSVARTTGATALTESPYTGDVTEQCSGFTFGNAARSYDYQMSTSGDSIHRTTRAMSAPDKYSTGGDPEMCALYWGVCNSTYTKTTSNEFTTRIVRIVDDVLDETFDVPSAHSIVTEWELSFSCDGDNYAATFSGGQHVIVNWDATSIGGIETGFSIDTVQGFLVEGAGPGNGSPVVVEEEGTPTRVIDSNRYGYESSYQFQVWEPVSLVGKDGVYSILGVSAFIPWRSGDRYEFATDPFLANEIFVTGLSHPGWGATSLGAFILTAGEQVQENEVRFYPSPYVTIFDSTFDVSVPVSIKYCFEKANQDLSSALTTTIVGLITDILDDIGGYEATETVYYSDLRYGPTFSVISRKRE